MSDKQKYKKKPADLGPINLTKTQYRPYIGGFPHRGKQNLRTMGPLENIMFDIPPIEESTSPIPHNSLEIMRSKIAKFFQQKSIKLKDNWLFYTKKANIVGSANSSWTELESYLLKIILQLISTVKNLTQTNIQLNKLKQELLYDNTNNLRSSQQSKLNQKMKTANITKLDNSINEYSNIIKNRSHRSKIIGRSEYREPSVYSSYDEINYTQINNENSNNALQMKITKLQKQIELYQQKIKVIQEQNSKKLIQMQRKVQSQLGVKYNQTIQQKIKFENEVQSKKFYNDILAQQFKTLKKKFQSLQSQNQCNKKQIEKLKEKNIKMNQLYQYRELWYMQNEQIIQIKQQLQILKQERDSEIKKNKGLKQKLKELSKNYNYNYNLSMENQRDKQDLNKVLKDFRDWLKFFAVPRVSKGLMNNNTFFPQMNLDSSKETYSNMLPNQDETNYKLLRPNFFIYFQAYEGIIMAERKFPQRKVMPPSFYLTIRAILDSMYLHFNFTTDFKQWYNFPQFAISFIQKFEINLETKKVINRKAPCQSQEKINFLLNIFNTQAANSWECEIFRSFIMQEFTLDQIYFYLQIRDNLLRGSQINNNFGSFDSIVFIRVSTAEQIIKQKLKNYDREMLERIKKFISSKKKIKNNRQLIDVNFVLKLLLEVYSIQKIKSERFFHHNFKAKNPNTKISYTQYSAFMIKNFEFLTKGDIAKLYREMYTLGVSHITYKTIHYVCSMRGLFIPLLRAKMTKYDVWGQTKNQKPFQDILYLDIQNNINLMTNCVEQFGIQQCVDMHVGFNHFLNNVYNSRLNRANFENKLLQETGKILKAKSILNWKNQKNFDYQQITKDQVRQRLSQLSAFVHQSTQSISSIKKYRQHRDKVLLKIVKNFKIRIQQSMAEFKAIDKKQFQQKIIKAEVAQQKREDDQESEKQDKLSVEDDKQND